jgi:hypothetical protein
MAAASQLHTMRLTPANQERQSPAVAADLAIAGLAAAGAVFAQRSWATDLESAGLQHWRGRLAIATAAITAWLLLTAWVHWRLARSRRSRVSSRRGLLWSLAAFNVGLAAAAGILLAQGHHSNLPIAGLSDLPPTIIAVALPSAASLCLTIYNRPHR